MSDHRGIPKSPYSPFWIAIALLAAELALTWFSMFVVPKFTQIFEDFGANVDPWTAFTFRLSSIFRSPFWIFGATWIIPIIAYRVTTRWSRQAKSPASGRLRLQVIFWLIPYGIMLLIGLMVVGLLMPGGGLQDVVK